MHARHRLIAEDLRLDHVRRDTALAQAPVDRRRLHVRTRVDPRIVEVRAAAFDRGSPTQHLGDLLELVEPDEIRHVSVLLRGACRVERRDGGRRRRREHRRRLHQLRSVARACTLDEVPDEWRDAIRAETLHLRPAETVGEHDDDLTGSIEERRIEVGQRRRIVRGAHTESVEHGRGHAEETSSCVIRRDRAHRAELLVERAQHRWTILRREPRSGSSTPVPL